MHWQTAGSVVALFVLGCAPSLKSRTAGSIGCPPSEIEISDEDTSTGFMSSSKTWVATCRDRRFICSENSTTSGGKDATFTDTNLSCREELAESPTAAPSNTASAPSAVTAANKAEPPKSAAGFEFGLEPETTRKSCEDAGKTWKAPSDKVGVCSGTTVDVGFPASVRFDFCGGKSCRITLVHRPESHWAAVFTELRDKLTAKYGEPKLLTGGIPGDCREEAKFVECLEDGSLRIRFSWAWTTKESVELSIGKSEQGKAPAAIRIQYSRPPESLHTNLNAL